MPDIPGKDQKADTPPATTEATPQMYAGKYRSIGDFEKGYWDTAQEGLRQRDARVRAEAERDALRQQLEQLNNRPTGPDPLANAFAEAEIPLDALDARVEAKALNVLQTALKPLMEVQSAESRVSQKFDDWPGLQAIQRELDPEAAESYRKLLAADPEAAMTLGYQAWKAKTPPQTPQTKESKVDVRSRQTASEVAKQSGGGTTDSPTADRERYKQLLQEAVMTGDWTQFNRFRFGNQPWFKRLAEGNDWQG